MTWIASLFLPGKRTISLSIVACIIAVLLQADAQGIFNIAPMLKLTLNLGLSLVIPMIPIYLRKGIQNALNEKANG
jgi:hypothetical protein